MNPNRIIQPNSWSCTACVAAMATGTTLKDVIKFIGHDGYESIAHSVHPDKRRGFSMQEILRYMLSLDYYMGICANINDRGNILDDEVEFFLNVSLETPAMAVIESPMSKKCSHAMYWDGLRLVDPAPSGKDNQKLEGLVINEWWPIVKFE